MKNNKNAIIITLVIMVVALSVGFAALSTNLTINGTGKVKSSNWDIHFKNLVGPTLKGTAKQITYPTVNATSISDYSVELKSPGDSIKYSIDIRNEGDFDAKLSSLTIPVPICTGSGSNAEVDAKNVCDYLTYSIHNISSDSNDLAHPIQNCSFEKGEECLLPKNAMRTVEITLEYSDKVSADKLPKSDVTVSNLGISMIFVQN